MSTLDIPHKGKNGTGETVTYASSGTDHSTLIMDEKRETTSSPTSFNGTPQKRESIEGVKLENLEGSSVNAQDESQYLSGSRLYLIMLGLGLACLLVGLVRFSPSCCTREYHRFKCVHFDANCCHQPG